MSGWVRASSFLIFLLFSSVAVARPRVVVGLREPVLNLSPFAPATIEGYRLTGLIFEPLARVDQRTNTLTPWLATSWTRPANGLVLRVTLRAEVKFHDGRTLEAGDVKHTFERFRAPENHAVTWLPLWAEVTRARVVSARIVEFDFRRRLTFEATRNLLTTLRIQPRHRPAGDLVGTGPAQRPVLRGDRVEFSAFAGWWQKPALTFDLTFRPVADAGVARDLIARGALDVFPGGGDTDAATVRAGPGEGLWLDLNLRRPLFKDVRTRRALLMLWDRADLNQKLFAGRRRIALDAFDPNVAAYPAGDGVPHDATAALKLLNTLGWRPRDGGLERDGEPFAFEILVGSAEVERWVTLLQSSLSAVGIHATVRRRAMDGEWWRILQRGDFDAAAGGGVPARGVNADAWRTNGAYNASGLSDAKLDRTLDQLNLEFDPARRTRLERAAILNARAQLVPLPGLIAPRGTYLQSSRLNIDVDAPDDVWRWRLTQTK